MTSEPQTNVTFESSWWYCWDSWDSSWCVRASHWELERHEEGEDDQTSFFGDFEPLTDFLADWNDLFCFQLCRINTERQFGSFQGNNSSTNLKTSNVGLGLSITGKTMPSSSTTPELSPKHVFLICLWHLFTFVLFFQDGTTRLNACTQSPMMTPF